MTFVAGRGRVRALRPDSGIGRGRGLATAGGRAVEAATTTAATCGTIADATSRTTDAVTDARRTTAVATAEAIAIPRTLPLLRATLTE